MQAYRKICALQKKVRVAIDSTGSLVQKVRIEGTVQSKHIFMHAMAVQDSPGGQFLCTQMLSEKSNTLTYLLWLLAFHQDGAPLPHECVMDFSRALLNAAVIAYSGYKKVKDYADALRKTELQRTFIKIDIAHFIKKYSTYLKAYNKRIKTFYLAAIGHLTQCTSEKEDEDLIRAIFIVSSSETDGKLPDGSKSRCQEAKEKLTKEITGKISYKN